MTFDHFNRSSKALRNQHGLTSSIYVTFKDIPGLNCVRPTKSDFPNPYRLLYFLKWDMVISFQCGSGVTEIRGIVPCLN